jgi:hypothetical protein
MRKRLGKWQSLVVLVFGLAQLSCKDLGVGVSTTVDGRVIVGLFEGYAVSGGPSEPKILLTMRTERIYGCCNFSILADVETGPRIITVTLQGIYEPEICLTALGPATYQTILPLSLGTYQLVMINGGACDKHTVEVTASSIRLTPGTSTVSSVLTPLSWRIPVRSFAYVCGTTVETAWIYNDFRDSLLKISSLREFSFPDSGQIPYPTSSSGHWQDNPAKYFTYATEADYDSAGALLKRYTHQVIGNKQGIGIYLTNWRNIQFMSWVLSQAQ